tara:strand:+ start:176 stop:349 length:174 start_codon:yes stop_codon:yes gene_type:complete
METFKSRKNTPKKSAEFLNKKILESHFIWCKENGRDVSWYEKKRKRLEKTQKKMGTQ